GTSAAAGTFISERTERIAAISSTSQLISSAAALSMKSGSGHAPSASNPPPFHAYQSSSVTNGMNGWRSATTWSSVQATVARISSLAASSVPLSAGLVSSRYQSHS